MSDAAIKPLTCDNPQTPIDLTHSPKCDSGSVKTPVNLPKPSSAVRNDEKNVSKPHNRKSAFTLAEGATHVDIFAKKRQVAFTLAEGATHVANCANIRKCAFTLAEVLITLGVIGIVAAMTLPAVVGKYRSMVVATQLKKLYSVTSQAMLKAMPDGDYSNIPIYDGGTRGAKNFFNDYLKPQFNIISVCTTDFSSCWKQTKRRDGKSNYGFSCGSGRPGDVVDFVTVDGFGYNVDTWNSVDYQVVYSRFGVKTSGKTPIAVIHVDANGLKRPNVIGKDVFVFVLNEKGLMPAGSDKTDDEVELECKTTGLYCFSHIMRNNWKIDPKDAW